jgi:hypothetical protein
MPSGSDMGGPTFSSRRPNAPSLSTFDLPPPPLASSQKYNYAVNGNHATHSPGVGNLLTPPSTVVDSPSSNASVNNVSSSAPAYPNGAYTSWSPSHAPAAYYAQPGNNQQFNQRNPYSPANSIIHHRGTHSPPTSENGQISTSYEVSNYTSSAPITPATLPSMGPQGQSQQMQNQMIGSSASVSSTHPSPVQAQEAFRPPPSPFYGQQSAPHSPYPYTTGPAGSHLQALSGPMNGGRPVISPGPQPVQSPHMQSPHLYQRGFAYGPVMSNMHNPNGQPMMVGALPHGIVPGFNSGHAASMQMYASPSPAPTPQQDRPFKCDQCPQSFNRNHDLKRHKRIHLAVKPFPCGHCDKSFSRKDALKVSEPIILTIQH